MAVVAAFKLDELVAAGDAPRQAQGAHGGLGAGVDHAYHFHMGHGLAHGPGQQHFVLAGRAVAGAFVHGGVQGLGHIGVGVAQKQRPPGFNIINISGAIHVGNGAAFARSDEQGRAVHGAAGPHRAVYPAGDNFLGFLKKFFGAGMHGGALLVK